MKNLMDLWLLSAANTENNDINMGSVLVSFLYFLGALMLIYLVLVLVNKWGKKRQGHNSEKTVSEQEQTDTDKALEKKKGGMGEDNG